MGLAELAPTFLSTWYLTAWQKVNTSLYLLKLNIEIEFHFILLIPCLYVLGVKEIDIAATLEHIRDQRPSMVRTKVRTKCTISLHGPLTREGV